MSYKLEDGSSVEEIPKNYSGCAKHIAGGQFWIKNGKPHRVDAPASLYKNGSCFWYFNGKRHCTTGQAIEDDSNVRFNYLLGHSILPNTTIVILN